MRPASHVIAIKVLTKSNMESPNCHHGTEKGTLAIITMGEVNGMMENQKAMGPSGLSRARIKTIMEAISGSDTGNINCWVSDSLSTDEPMAAKMAAYSKYPKRKKKRKSLRERERELLKVYY